MTPKGVEGYAKDMFPFFLAVGILEERTVVSSHFLVLLFVKPKIVKPRFLWFSCIWF